MKQEIKTLFNDYVNTHTPQECAELQGSLIAIMLIKSSKDKNWLK